MLKNFYSELGLTPIAKVVNNIKETIMYKQVETDKISMFENGALFDPIATLADEHGGRCQISIDDHCYNLSLKQEDGKYKTTPYIFSEAFEVLKTLPYLAMP